LRNLLEGRFIDAVQAVAAAIRWTACMSTAPSSSPASPSCCATISSKRDSARFRSR
jgi:hypothetical protein